MNWTNVASHGAVGSVGRIDEDIPFIRGVVVVVVINLGQRATRSPEIKPQSQLHSVVLVPAGQRKSLRHIRER